MIVHTTSSMTMNIEAACVCCLTTMEAAGICTDCQALVESLTGERLK